VFRLLLRVSHHGKNQGRDVQPVRRRYLQPRKQPELHLMQKRQYVGLEGVILLSVPAWHLLSFGPIGFLCKLRCGSFCGTMEQHGVSTMPGGSCDAIGRASRL